MPSSNMPASMAAVTVTNNFLISVFTLVVLSSRLNGRFFSTGVTRTFNAAPWLPMTGASFLQHPGFEAQV